MPPADARRYMKRAGLFAAGLVLLWIALQLFPDRYEAAEPPVYSDESGTVASRAEPLPSSEAPGLVTPGNAAALLLLVGGIGLAVYLRRRTQSKDGPSPFMTIGNCAVGPNQSLRLVRCGGEILLLGVASGQVNLLKTYPADAFRAEDVTRDASAPIAAGNGGIHFGDVLRRYAGRQGQIETNGAPC